MMKKKQLKISIIIPVYNSKKYLKECVRSILNQTYQNYEIILVDDESTDGSEKICDNFSKQDKRIITLHKKNGGTASARNMGIKKASGDYITFIDNDDYWKMETALNGIVKNLSETHADILMFDTLDYFENTNKFVTPTRRCDRDKIAFKDKVTALTEIISNGCMKRAVWAKVIKTSLITSNNILFEDGIRNEDTDFTGKLLLVAESYDWYSDLFYVYRKGTGQAQTDKKINTKIINDLYIICKNFIDTVKHSNISKDFRNVLYSYIAYPFAVLIGQCYEFKKNLEKDQLITIKKYSFVLNYDIDPSIKLVKKIYRIFGYNITALLLKIYLNR